MDGFVSLEVSPKLAYDTQSTLAAAKQLPGAAIEACAAEADIPARRRVLR
ncbi:MAG: hypothetical protein M1353_02625 [Nitrospirae bacterium]|nr:hypothetical protein [Nitrospirota bacterium]